MQHSGRLRKWRFHRHPHGAYLISGDIFGSDHFADGNHVTLKAIRQLISEADGLYVRTVADQFFLLEGELA